MQQQHREQQRQQQRQHPHNHQQPQQQQQQQQQQQYHHIPPPGYHSPKCERLVPSPSFQPIEDDDLIERLLIATDKCLVPSYEEVTNNGLIFENAQISIK